MHEFFRKFAHQTSYVAGSPWAFILAVAIILAWGISGPIFGFSDTWQLVINTGTTIVTFLMVFLIQSAQNRDAAAIQAKLDELVRAIDHARNEFIGIEHLTEDELDSIREEIEAEFGEKNVRAEALARLIRRR
ncbi:MAG TPA: low affinity iron permease family protein [Beijerinckiaceae bacterium]|nr:low affinity iron permease family protein [Beijerinckiaceae bacterium]